MLYPEESLLDHAGNLRTGHHHFGLHFFVDVYCGAVPYPVTLQKSMEGNRILWKYFSGHVIGGGTDRP